MPNILPIKRKEDGTEDDGDGERAQVAEPAQVEDEPTDEAAAKKKSLAALREWIDQSKQRLEDWQKQVDQQIQSAKQ